MLTLLYLLIYMPQILALLAVAALATAIYPIYTSKMRPALKTHLFPSTKAAWITLILLVGLGLILRIGFGPAAPIHCNTHGIREIRLYLTPEYKNLRVALYGKVFPSAIWAALNIAGRTAGSLFLLNTIFGALAVAAMFSFVKGLGLGGAPALFSALLMCVSPSMVWISSTESQMPLCLLIALSGLSLLCAAVKDQNPYILWCSALFIAFASCLRIITVMLLPAAVLIYIYLFIFNTPAGDRTRAFRAHSLICLLTSSILVAWHYSAITAMAEKGWGWLNPVYDIARFLSGGNILWDITLTPAPVPAMAVAGFIIAWRRHRRLAILLAAITLLIAPLSFVVLDCRTTALRYQANTQWIYYTLSAIPLAAAISPLQPSRRKTLLLSAAALAALNSAIALPLLKRGDEDINEYRFIKQHAPNIPPGTTIILPVKHAARGKLITDFPDYLNGHKIAVGIKPEDAPHNHLIFIGLDCYRYERNSPMREEIGPSLMQTECENICRGRKLAPIYKQTISTARPRIGYQRQFYPFSTQTPTIGFYKCESE